MRYLIYSVLFVIVNACGAKHDSAKNNTDINSLRLIDKKNNGANCFDKSLNDATKINKLSLTCVNNTVKTLGLIGHMHASVPEYGYFVFTLRGKSFFDHYEFSIYSIDANVQKKMANLTRHDKVLIRGEVAALNSPLRHIKVTDFKILKKYTKPLTEVQSNYNNSKLIQFFQSHKGPLRAIVHAKINGGKALVLDVNGAIVPLLISKQHKDLYSFVDSIYRGDKIDVSYTLRTSPRSPMHLETNILVKNPIKIVEKLVDLHANENTIITGELVVFLKSPQINRDIYAIRVVQDDGTKRNWVVFPIGNFDKNIKPLKEIFEKNKATAIKDRNQYLLPNFKITVRGLSNIVSQHQANPQIFISSSKSISIE